jgi:hypothetical protein
MKPKANFVVHTSDASSASIMYVFVQNHLYCLLIFFIIKLNLRSFFNSTAVTK